MWNKSVYVNSFIKKQTNKKQLKSGGVAFQGSQGARNDTSNKRIIRLKKQNGKFAVVHRRFLRSRRCTMLILGDMLIQKYKVTPLIIAFFSQQSLSYG